jgi:diacylglycerol kinase (ATP)
MEKKVDSMKILFFIINVKAKNGKSLTIWRKLNKLLEKQSIPYRSFFTHYPGHAEVLAKQIAEMHGEKALGIIAVGGDGTIHEVVNGLSGFPSIKIGYIPAGSGNDFARGFGLPRKSKEALMFILSNFHKDVSSIELGQCYFPVKQSRRTFVNSIGAGFDAEISKYTNESNLKKWFGKFSYVIALLRKSFEFKPVKLELSVDEIEYKLDNVWFVTVSNHPYYGGGMKISPQAKLNDGQLNITVVHNLSPFKLVALFGSVFFGKHVYLKEVLCLSGKSIKIHTESPIPVHTDGEVIGETPVHIHIRQEKVQFICRHS